MAEKRRRIDSDALSLGELFRRPVIYSVPVYQRDFAWTVDEVDTLWEDLAMAITDDRSEYFLGAVTVNEDPEAKKCEVIDGQQRLAVLSMIFAAIADFWKSQGKESRFHGVFRDYLGAEDRRTGQVLPKLTMNETNDPIYQAVVLRGQKYTVKDKKLWPASNALLDDAHDAIQKHVEEWTATFDDAESAVLDLEEYLSAKVNIILIQTSDESDAFVLFETLNDRGLDLAVSDLVKNYLFSLSGAYLERFKKVWIEVATLVGSENLTMFLRHCWLSEYELVREKELYRTLRAKVKGTTGMRQFVEALRKKAEFYAALTNPEHAYWVDLPTDVREHLDALLLFKVTQFRPVLLSAMETQKGDFVAKILRMVQIVSFRYTVISALGTGNLEKIYSDCAIALREKKVKGIKDVFLRLKSAYVDDDRFATNFADKRFSNAAIARYILAELNDALETDREKRVDEGTGRITLEHIMPKTRSKAWTGAADNNEEADEHTDKIGNLTLLEKGKNRGIANVSFEEKKKKAYATSSLALNRDLANVTDWNVNEIRKRSTDLAKVARKVWCLDY